MADSVIGAIQISLGRSISRILDQVIGNLPPVGLVGGVEVKA